MKESTLGTIISALCILAGIAIRVLLVGHSAYAYTGTGIGVSDLAGQYTALEFMGLVLTLSGIVAFVVTIHLYVLGRPN